EQVVSFLQINVETAGYTREGRVCVAIDRRRAARGVDSCNQIGSRARLRNHHAVIDIVATNDQIAAGNAGRHISRQHRPPLELLDVERPTAKTTATAELARCHGATPLGNEKGLRFEFDGGRTNWSPNPTTTWRFARPARATLAPGIPWHSVA